MYVSMSFAVGGWSLVMPSFFSRTFCAATIAGVRLRTFFASLVLRLGGLVGAVDDLRGAGVQQTGRGMGLDIAATKEVGEVGMTPSSMCSVLEPLEMLMNAGAWGGGLEAAERWAVMSVD